MRRIVPILMLLLLVVNCAFADTYYVFCTPNDFVNVRMMPDGVATAWVECGSAIETDGKAKKYGGKTWYHVVNLASEDSSGWICSQFLSESPIVFEEYIAYCSAKDRVAIRKSPNGKVKKWLYNCEEIKVIAHNDEWAITPQGYVKLEFLDFYSSMEDYSNEG